MLKQQRSYKSKMCIHQETSKASVYGVYTIKTVLFNNGINTKQKTTWDYRFNVLTPQS